MGIKPQNIYGMTENGSHQYTLPDDDASTITSTCGKACAGYETRLWDQENPDREAEPGEIGEIGTRGALLMLGYFDNQAATENSFNAGGWFMSGDLGRFDEQGNLQIVGRKKDLIIRGGHNIHPADIENRALKHPGVLKAAAYPVADVRLGERVCLAIVPREGAQLDRWRCSRTCTPKGFRRYDMPEYFIAMEVFPLTASGKILKRELVEWTKAGRVSRRRCAGWIRSSDGGWRIEHFRPHRRRTEFCPGRAHVDRQRARARARQDRARARRNTTARGEFPWDNIEAINGLGLNAMFVPEAYGGARDVLCGLSRVRAGDIAKPAPRPASSGRPIFMR